MKQIMIVFHMLKKNNDLTYELLLESEYSNTLYKYYSNENQEYYLVCLTEIKYKEKDLSKIIEDGDLTLDELNQELKQNEIDSLKIVRTIEEESSDEKEKTSNEVETDKTSSNSNKTTSNNSSSSSSNNNPSSGSATSSKEKDNATLKKQLAASGLSWDFNTKAEAFMKKWVNRGFTAGYYVNNYGDSDTAYSGYIQLLAVNYSCLESNLNVDWHNETSAMKYPILYLYSLEYDVSGKCAFYDGIVECF